MDLKKAILSIMAISFGINHLCAEKELISLEKFEENIKLPFTHFPEQLESKVVFYNMNVINGDRIYPNVFKLSENSQKKSIFI